MGVGLGGGNFISGAELVADEGSAFSTLGCCSLFWLLLLLLLFSFQYLKMWVSVLGAVTLFLAPNSSQTRALLLVRWVAVPFFGCCCCFLSSHRIKVTVEICLIDLHSARTNYTTVQN